MQVLPNDESLLGLIASLFASTAVNLGTLLVILLALNRVGLQDNACNIVTIVSSLQMHLPNLFLRRASSTKPTWRGRHIY
jgi:hypothetical protein